MREPSGTHRFTNVGIRTLTDVSVSFSRILDIPLEKTTTNDIKAPSSK